MSFLLLYFQPASPGGAGPRADFVRLVASGGHHPVVSFQWVSKSCSGVSPCKLRGCWLSPEPPSGSGSLRQPGLFLTEEPTVST